MTREPTSEGRRMCYRCMRPTVACVCVDMVAVENRTHVVVFQHPRERFHPLGTARLVRLGLRSARVETLFPDSPTPPLRAEQLSKRAALLYPSRDAVDLEDLPPDSRPDELVVIDGTWHHARCLFRDTPWLRCLPRVKIRPEAPSRYRIRREPRPECLSTVEAIARALRVLEPDTPGLSSLTHAFDQMIDRQIELGATARKVPRVRRRDLRPKCLPRALFESPERIVVVYGESALTGAEPGATRRARSLVQWSAVRPSSGELFERLIRPERALCRPWHLGHMGVTAHDLSRGVSESALVRAWRRFIEPSDVLVAWNQGVLDLIIELAGHHGPTLCLKSVCRAMHPEARGAIDDVLLRRGVHPATLALRGRAAARLGNALALVRHLRDDPPTP